MAFILTISLFNADFPIATLGTDERYPCASFANNQYYIFWSDFRADPLYALYGARISTTGTVLDPNGKFLFQDTVLYPAVAYDGTNLLVVWREGC